MATVREVTGWLESAYPPALAEDWDRVGLAVGDPDAEVGHVHFAVDVTDAVIAEAVAAGAHLLVTHHPLLLRGIHAVRTDQPKGRLVTALLRAGIAQFAAHTNADSAPEGVAEALASACGLSDLRPLRPVPSGPLDKVVTFVPTADAEAVIDALAAAGAGAIGDYERCAFTATGTGTFRPLEGAQPTIGSVGAIERVEEVRVEMVLPRGRRDAVVAALRAAHPYEEPAFDVLELAPEASDRGLGRIGQLPKPVTAREFARRVAAAVPATAGGVKLGGDPDRLVETVAVLGGAGDSLLDAVRAAGVDAYVTGDLRHHVAQDFLAHDGAPVLVDVPHWAAEWTWLPLAQRVLDRAAADAGVRVGSTVSRIVTDPWSARF
ncbi:MAG: Nif3-like dinuclear metal center hexameric protein [Propionibacteriaceae bacterium]|nr:Nif3-like dinuclear metal center hexameric protein [Propionibacteriaceae bacterium]